MTLVQELINSYDEGIVTKGELLNKLVGLANDITPSEIVSDLPEEYIAEIKRMVESPPETIEDLFMLGSVTYKPGVDIDSAVEKDKERSFNAMWKMHDYLYK
ncbi:hypothetical protein ACJJIF_13310 [Microbulbifer sp. SSSA002]|uniref:hypothetical protein n=1 Tax=Microbulbifer sp. SSSA002 TaxID=3243376 RepID=UPI004039A8CD